MNLSDLVPSLERALAIPGTFATLFPETTAEDLADTLADAVCEAQLDGFLSTTTLDVALNTVDPDLTSAQRALVVLYAMSRVVDAKVANLKNRTRYKAGANEAETEQSASVLQTLLRQIAGHKLRLLEEAKAGNLATAFAMVDLYIAKSIDTNSADLQYMAVPPEPRF
jgi:Cdc6-like AAA superfamily ATPase